MAMKIDRRAFLKTSAAMAVAVSMTGLLGGCSDGDGSTKFGRFQATVGALREKDNAMVGGVAAEWKGDVMVKVRIKDCSEDKKPEPVYASSHFYLNINGTSIENYAVGDLLEKDGKIPLTKGQLKEDWMLTRRICTMRSQLKMLKLSLQSRAAAREKSMNWTTTPRKDIPL